MMKKDSISIGQHSFPSVSIILPVDKKYPHFKNDEEKMKSLLKQTEHSLLKEFPKDKVKPLIDDMYRLAEGIDYKKLSDGLGLFVSPQREKLIHFPFPVKEKVIIDKTFEVRDLIYTARNNFRYAVISISEKMVRVFNGNNHSLQQVQKEDMPYDMHDVAGEGHSRVGSFTSFSSSRNFSDQKEFAEKQLDKYLLEIDRVILKDEELKDCPLVICASKRISGHFNRISKNKKHILGYVTGNFDLANVKEIEAKVSGLTGKQQLEIQQAAIKQLEKAMGEKKVVTGIHKVWQAAYNREGKVLMVEKDYYTPGKTGKKNSHFISHDLDKTAVNYMEDAVDDVIEMVLKYKGDVVFMDNGRLSDYDRIALITYY